MKERIKELLGKKLKAISHIADNRRNYVVMGIEEAAEEISKLIPQWIPVNEGEWIEGREYVVIACGVYRYIAEYHGAKGWFDDIQKIYLVDVEYVYDLPPLPEVK